MRFFYCSVTDERDQTPELAKIGLQPRRDAGAAQAQPLPDAPGTATFNAATRELTVPELPPHATSLKGWRQPAAGAAEVAGVSLTETVAVAEFSPLVPGVTYRVWVTGHNFARRRPGGEQGAFYRVGGRPAYETWGSSSPSRSLIFTRSCAPSSRWRRVTVSSRSGPFSPMVSKSMVTQNGVPPSSWRA